jgi:hypothetical protein
MEKNPDHPGAVHYAIHAFDDPIHAPLGLPAARAYSGIAPAAAHAQHMTTHIFLALGMWELVVKQNEIASGIDRRDSWKPGHYTAWLGYGLLQQGRLADARSHLELVRRNTTASEPPGRRGYLMSMRAHYLLNSEQWTDTTLLFSIDPAGVGPVPRAVDAFALGYTRFKRGEIQLAGEQLRALRDLSAAGRLAIVGVLERELDALLKLAERDTTGALNALVQAAAIEDTLPMEFGPPDIVKPTHELLGELQLQLNHPADAKREFQRALALTPGRMRSLLRLHRAATAEGDSAVAAQALSELRSVLVTADAGLPELKELSQGGGRNRSKGGSSLASKTH